MTTLAITGATGFVGQTLVRIAVERGFAVRALARSSQPARDGVSWIEGALDQPEALARLVAGCDAVIHVAGVVNAPDRAGFAAGNIAGTRAMVEATQGRVERFIHVSSLAAREPALSNYGWSKAEAERVVEASGLEWAVVRPPAIYGPGDLEMLDLFRFAKRGVVPLPPAGRMSVVEVGDLARLLLALADAGDGGILEPDDGHPGGWSHVEFAKAIGSAIGRNALPVPLPGPLLNLASRVDRFLRGPRAKLTADRVSYIRHPDWTADPSRRPSPALWTPQVETIAGLAATACAYEAAGLL